ncbi:MAG: hypothetical protein JWQ32_1057 [Marmoricola sp.]|nr:hypothetical protein [Marmoricola sp.]
MKRLVLVLAVTAGMLVLSPGPSWACSCVSGTTADHVKRAETILDGTLEWTSSNGLTTTYGVQVEDVFKGRAGVREKLLSPANAATCGLGDLATNERYVFFVTGIHPGVMQVTSCGGSAPYAAALAAQVRAATGPPGRPIPEPVAVVSGHGSGHRWAWITGVLVIGAAVTGALTWSRRRLTV